MKKRIARFVLGAVLGALILGNAVTGQVSAVIRDFGEHQGERKPDFSDEK